MRSRSKRERELSSRDREIEGMSTVRNHIDLECNWHYLSCFISVRACFFLELAHHNSLIISFFREFWVELLHRYSCY